MKTISKRRPWGRSLNCDAVVHCKSGSRIAAAVLALCWLPASAATLHVRLDSPAPALPYDTWDNAAHTIQEAIDVAVGNDTVLVYDGVYDTGERAGQDSWVTRVVIDRALTVQSLNGPEVTVIDGAEAVRCADLHDGAILSGFTLTGGVSKDGGITGSGGGAWCASGGIVTNCVLTDNHAQAGGGARGGTLCDCTLSGNGAGWGGGAHSATLYNCTLNGNVVYESGGGAYGGALYHCTLTQNHAAGDGGAASGSMLTNCLLTGNSVLHQGGGAAGSTLYNCTVTANSCGPPGGGGVSGSTLYNCIVYYNSGAPVSGADPNYDPSSSLSYSCATPLPPGVGNIAQDPAFVNSAAGDYHLQFGSACINTGINQDWMTGATDLDGNPRISMGVVDMGASELPDSDGVGVPDVIDVCPGTPAGEVVNSNGCSISQLVPASGPWRNHGEYVSAVTKVAEQFVAEGLITEAQKDQIVADAAKSTIGKPS